MKRLIHALLSMSLVIGFTATLIPTAQAVVQNISVVGPDGQNIGKQTVKIVFPEPIDGKTSAEAETDDDGLLIFDFPGDGRYIIEYDGGSMPVDVAGGIPMWGKIGLGVVGAGAVIYAIDESGNGGNGGNGGGNGGTNGGNGGVNGGNGGTNGGNGGVNGGNGGVNGGNGGTNGGNGGTNGGNGGIADPSGEFNTVSFVTTSNPAMHPESVFAGATYVITKNLDTGEIEIVIIGAAPGASATLTGTCDEDGNYTVTGPGTFAGFTTTFSMSGTFTADGVRTSFTISGGNDGGLPMGEPIVGDGTAEK